MRIVAIMFIVLAVGQLIADESKDSGNVGRTLPSVDSVDGTSVVMEPLKVTAERVEPYVLMHIASQNRWCLHRAKKISDDLGTTGSGVIWTDTGLWNHEIVAVSGRNVTGYSHREMNKLVFGDTNDRLTIELKSRGGRRVFIEAYTHRGGWVKTRDMDSK